MGRTAEGWKLVWKRRRDGTPVAHVRFTVAGVRVERTTQQTEKGKAAARAQDIYASAVAGKLPRRRAVMTGGRALDDLGDEWLGSLLLTPATVDVYEIYVRQWIAFFRVLHGITTENVRAYYAARLRSVVRSTVRKELSALRGFLRWAKDAGALHEVPFVPIPERNVTGTRANPKRKTEAVELDAREMGRLLAALPAAGKKWEGKVRHPRAFFTVAWETGLRPATLHRLEAGRHYRRGGADLTLTDDTDKARWGRSVPLTSAARAALDSVWPKNGKGLLFPPCDWRRTLKAAAAKAKLPADKVARLSKYDIRHARVTNLIDRTADMTGTAYLVGHKLLSTTDKYAHPTRRAGDRVVEALGKKRVDRKRNSGAIRVRGSKKESER